MKTHLQPPRYLLLTALTLLTALVWYVHRSGSPANIRHGKFSELEIVSRSTSLCQRLFSGTESLKLCIYQTQATLTVPTQTPYWLVDFTDPAGYRVVCMEWNGQTGELATLMVNTGSHFAPPTPLAQAPELVSAAQAQTLAKEWLVVVGVRLPEGKAPSESVTPQPRNWHVGWRAGQQTLALTLAKRSGLLLSLNNGK